MLKIKDSIDLNKILEMSNFEYEADCSYEEQWSYAQYCDGNIVLDCNDNKNIYIRGVDDTKLDLLYDLIKADLVEKVEGDE